MASLIALGAGLLLFSMPLGVVFLAAAGLATARTSVAGARRRREGRPLGRDEAVLVFAKSLGGAFLVMVSAAIAFVVTCFPIGLLTAGNGPEDQLGGSLVVAFVVGGVSAAVAGGFVTYQLFKKRRRPAPKGPPAEDRP